MSAFFTFCAVLGGTILVCQFVMMVAGMSGDDGAMDTGDADLGDITDIADSPDGHDAGGHHGSTWLFTIISFRTLVAAATFFGLGGLLAESMELRPGMQLSIGLALGFAAMVGVHKLMGLFHRMGEDGTVKIQRAVGSTGTVYIPIPPNKAGAGKIQISLQNRIMEYPAITANNERLSTGTKVVVVDIIGTSTLEVAPAREPAETPVA